MTRPRSIMTDIETLSTNKRALIQSIGAVAFDDDGFLNDYDKINAVVFYGQVPWRDASQVNLGRVIDNNTMQWWSSQGDPLHKLQSPGVADLPYMYAGLAPLLEEFSRFVKAELRNGGKMLSKGIDFDLAILDSAFTDLGKEIPWRYNATRCMRGYVDAAVAAGISQHLHMGVFGGNVMPHHAAEDAIFQTKVFIRYAHELWKIRHKGAQQGFMFEAPLMTGAAPPPAPGSVRTAYTGTAVATLGQPLTLGPAPDKLEPAP